MAMWTREIRMLLAVLTVILGMGISTAPASETCDFDWKPGHSLPGVMELFMR